MLLQRAAGDNKQTGGRDGNILRREGRWSAYFSSALEGLPDAAGALTHRR